MTEFEDQDSAGLEVGEGLCDEFGVEFVALFAAEQGDCGFVFADFTRQRRCFATANVGRVAYNKVKENRALVRDS